MSPRLAFLGRLLPLRQFDLQAWKKLDLEGRIRLGSQMWADSGFGTPVAIHLFYLVKIFLWLQTFCYLLSFSDLDFDSHPDTFLVKMPAV